MNAFDADVMIWSSVLMKAHEGMVFHAAAVFGVVTAAVDVAR